jgi:ABC-type Fe3+/spermidine/putrescine transport system ATPase subunit
VTSVSITNLSKTYHGSPLPALDNLSLDIASGAMTAVLGPSGCGKTTMLKIIAGLMPSSSGDVAFDGRSILRDKPEDRGVVMVFQSALLFPFMSVAGNVGFGLRMRKMSKQQIAGRVAQILDLVKLPGLSARKPADLSGGQQQRVALARALIVEPKVLLLDEPLSNLDAHLRLEMRDLIRGLQRQLGITTLFVTHDQEEAVALADHVALIVDGRLSQHGTPDIFYKRPVNETVARFFGGQNFVAGQSQGGVFQSALGPLTMPENFALGAGLLTIRPEAIRIGAGPINTVTAKVTDKTYLGAVTRLLLRVGEIDLVSVQSPDVVEGIAQGQSIKINLPPQSLWVMV